MILIGDNRECYLVFFLALFIKFNLFLAIFSNFEHARQLKEKNLTNQHMHFQAWGRNANYV